MSLSLSNPVDPATLDALHVVLTPPAGEVRVESWWDGLAIRAATTASTTYHVALRGGLRDTFGQELVPWEGTFRVGRPTPRIAIVGGSHLVLDPAAPPVLRVLTMGLQRLRVRVLDVSPGDWVPFRDGASRMRWDETVELPGDPVAAMVLDVPGGGLAWTAVDVDLEPSLERGLGQLGVVVEPGDRMDDRERRSLAQGTWVQATQLGVDIVSDATHMGAWVTRLVTGTPVEGARVTVGTATAVTGPDGTCRMALPAVSAEYALVHHQGDVALLPADSWRGWSSEPEGDRPILHVFDDRGLYRPGEQVHIKAWLRRLTSGPHGDVLPAALRAAGLGWRLSDAVGNEVAIGQVELDALGGFDVTVDLPATVNLGPASFEVTLPHGDRHRHPIRIAEFRRPEYEVVARALPDRAIAGDAVTAEVAATYFAGGALRDAATTWDVTAVPARYSPPGWDAFTFGTARAWWRFLDDDDDTQAHAAASGITGPDGVHRLRIATTAGSVPRAWSVTAEATVADVNRQAWTARTSFLVHPSAVCVGMRADRSFVSAGRALTLAVVATDIDGVPVPGVPLTMRAERREQRQVKGTWADTVVETVERDVVSGVTAIELRLDGLAGGRWTLALEAADADARPYRSSLEVWIAGRGAEPDRRNDASELELVPDRRAYAPGDTAEILVPAPFTPAEGLLLLERDGILEARRFTVTEPLHALGVAIEDGMTPGLHAHVLLVGATPRDDIPGSSGPAGTPRPAYAEGTVRLAVPPLARTLAVTIAPQVSGLRPGESTVLDLHVATADDAPVPGATAAVYVVDESVLAVAGYQVPDPIAQLYPDREPGTETTRSRPLVILGRPADPGPAQDDAPGLTMAEAMSPMMLRAAPLPMMAMAGAMPPGAAPTPPPIRARADFAALALFAASVTTGSDGRASVDVRLPDNLTRYRVIAVATDGGARFGVGESALTARLPLMVRPSAPRFLAWGDHAELPVVIANQADAPLEVDVAVRAGNLALTAGAGRRLVVPAGDRAEVRFPATTDGVGEAMLEIAAAAGPDADAAVITFPVRTPATTEAFAVHGTLDNDTLEQPVRAPASAVTAFGGLEVTLASTGVAALADAVLAVTAYPFECTEQLASRILAVAALRDVLGAFAAPGLPSPADLESAVNRDIASLASRQAADGGLGWWRRDDETWPYLGAHVGNALARARAKGFAVPDDMIARLLDYLRTVERRFPRHYPADAKAAIEAYAIHVRAALGDADPTRARALLARRGADAVSVEGLAWLLPVLGADRGSDTQAREVRRLLANRVVETPATASVTVRHHDGAHLILASDRRADAVVLDALIADQPQSPLIPKLVAGLQAHRVAGHWGSTQENAFILLALGRYADVYEAVTPDFTARLWVGGRFGGAQPFHGRSTDRTRLEVPMADLAAGGGRHDLLLASEGPGRLYYRLGLRYAPASLDLAPLDRGFEVLRRYAPLDDPEDVRRDPDGTWRIRAGARVRVTLTMTARSRRHHVALVDPLPAGLEVVDPGLATSARDSATGGTDVGVVGGPGLGGPGRGMGHWWWWSRPWFDHENLRDDRAEAFATLLWEGDHTYAYTVRATTPGSFTAAPARAEEMYSPETFGRSATDRIVVE